MTQVLYHESQKKYFLKCMHSAIFSAMCIKYTRQVYF
jgi:hypothetical protein